MLHSLNISVKIQVARTQITDPLFVFSGCRKELPQMRSIKQEQCILLKLQSQKHKTKILPEFIPPPREAVLENLVRDVSQLLGVPAILRAPGFVNGSLQCRLSSGLSGLPFPSLSSSLLARTAVPGIRTHPKSISFFD